MVGVDFLQPAHVTQAQQLARTAAGSSEMPRHLRAVKQLGRGAYGSVHLCEDSNTGGQVAVKHIKNAARHGKSILREVRLLSRLRHENLLHLLDFPALSGPDFEDVFLVLPYMPTDLHKVIQSRQTLSEKHIQVIICQIFRALAHLHGAGVAHRDLKPANILLTADCRLKICDFGLARGDMHMGSGAEASDGEEAAEVCGVLTEYVVTRWYRAPEVMLLPKQYSTALDIWAVGCIVCEILGRRAIFPGKNHVDMICRCARTLGTPTDEELTWLPKNSDAYKFLRNVCPQSDGVPMSSLYPNAAPACLRLARSLLEWDPSQRPTAAEAQAHEYLKSYLPKQPPSPAEPFDWGFDGFRPTLQAVKDRLYRESLRFHPAEPESQRDRSGSGRSTTASSTPRSLQHQRSESKISPPVYAHSSSERSRHRDRSAHDSARYAQPQQQQQMEESRSHSQLLVQHAQQQQQQQQHHHQEAKWQEHNMMSMSMGHQRSNGSTSSQQDQPLPMAASRSNGAQQAANNVAPQKLPPAPPAALSGGKNSARRSASNLHAAIARSATPVRGAGSYYPPASGTPLGHPHAAQRVTTEFHPASVQAAPWMSSSCMVR
mmetsp:Transcript_41415/g.97264  ORF Transcript_41415/g.97264 Transcript_41415/m.97264 type:complete len:602 (+) Transcript_41415:52-1857(+)